MTLETFANPHIGAGLDSAELQEAPAPSVDAAAPLKLLSLCPAHGATPLLNEQKLAEAFRVGTLFLKDERQRMGLGSFKALGAAYVIAHEASLARQSSPDTPWETCLIGTTYVTASAGNHGMSVAAGAPLFGAKAVIYLANTVPEDFARRLKAKGAEVVRAGDDYEASMEAALQAADENGWQLLSDSSWEGYYERPHRLMEGYLVMAQEAADEMATAPTHIFLQAGVGGLAGAMAAHARHFWGNDPTIVVVEPEYAPAVAESIKAGKPVIAPGPVSSMGRLDCKEPSLIALKGLARDANFCALVSEEEAADTVNVLAANDVRTTPSGCAQLAPLLNDDTRAMLGIDETSTVLAFISEVE